MSWISCTVSSMSWLSWTVSSMIWIGEDEFGELDKFNCKLVELAKLRMIWMSWISCTVSSMNWLG